MICIAFHLLVIGVAVKVQEKPKILPPWRRSARWQAYSDAWQASADEYANDTWHASAEPAGHAWQASASDDAWNASAADDTWQASAADDAWQASAAHDAWKASAANDAWNASAADDVWEASAADDVWKASAADDAWNAAAADDEWEASAADDAWNASAADDVYWQTSATASSSSAPSKKRPERLCAAKERSERKKRSILAGRTNPYGDRVRYLERNMKKAAQSSQDKAFVEKLRNKLVAMLDLWLQ